MQVRGGAARWREDTGEVSLWLRVPGELKARDVVYRKNPGVHALQVAPATSRRPSMEDFNAMTAEVGEAREAAAVERAAGSAAMERLRKSLDAFTIKHAKPFCDIFSLVLSTEIRFRGEVIFIHLTVRIVSD